MNPIPIQLTGKERTPPSEFLLIPFGPFTTLKGDFNLTQRGAAMVIEKYQDHGTDICIDFEHAALAPPADGAPAAGWAKLTLKSDGLWLTNIKWSDRAHAMLSAGEYRYHSPAFNIDPDTGEVIEVINCALTNLPATDSLEPLVAANRLKGAKTMKRAFAKHLKEQCSKHGGEEGLAKFMGIEHAKLSEMMSGKPPAQEEMSAACEKLGIKKEEVDECHSLDGMDVNAAVSPGSLGDLFELATPDEDDVPGNGDEADEDQHGAVAMSRQPRKLSSTKVFEELVKLTGERDPAALTSYVVALKADAEKGRAAMVELNALKSKIQDIERANLIEKGKVEGKLTPALIALYRNEPVIALRKYLAAASPISGELQEPTPATGTTAGGSTMVKLTREDKEVAKLSNIKEDEFAKIKEELGEREVETADSRNAPILNARSQNTAWDRKFFDHLHQLSLDPEACPIPKRGRFITATRLPR